MQYLKGVFTHIFNVLDNFLTGIGVLKKIKPLNVKLDDFENSINSLNMAAEHIKEMIKIVKEMKEDVKKIPENFKEKMSDALNAQNQPEGNGEIICESCELCEKQGGGWDFEANWCDYSTF